VTCDVCVCEQPNAPVAVAGSGGPDKEGTKDAPENSTAKLLVEMFGKGVMKQLQAGAAAGANGGAANGQLAAAVVAATPSVLSVKEIRVNCKGNRVAIIADNVEGALQVRRALPPPLLSLAILNHLPSLFARPFSLRSGTGTAVCTFSTTTRYVFICLDTGVVRCVSIHPHARQPRDRSSRFVLCARRRRAPCTRTTSRRTSGRR
jgi:hypothetical protein